MKQKLRRYNPDIVNELKDYMREKCNENILGTANLVQRAINEIEQLRDELGILPPTDFDQPATLKPEGTPIKVKNYG